MFIKYRIWRYQGVAFSLVTVSQCSILSVLTRLGNRTNVRLRKTCHRCHPRLTIPDAYTDDEHTANTKSLGIATAPRHLVLRSDTGVVCIQCLRTILVHDRTSSIRGYVPQPGFAYRHDVEQPPTRLRISRKSPCFPRLFSPCGTIAHISEATCHLLQDRKLTVM